MLISIQTIEKINAIDLFLLAPIGAITPQQGGTTMRGVKADSGK